MFEQLFGFAFEHDAPAFQHVTKGSNAQRCSGVLLDDQHRQPEVAIDRLQNRHDLVGDDRRETERKLIDQQKLRLANQRHADRQHLLFAAAQIAGDLLSALGQPREVIVDRVADWPPLCASG